LKILMVVSEAPPIKSGISRVAEKLERGFTRRGHQVDILSLEDVPRWERGELRLSSMPFRLNQLKKRFQEYDLIHLHGPVPTFSDAFLLLGLRGLDEKRPPLVYTHHAPIYLHHRALKPLAWVYNQIQKHLANQADHIVATTQGYGQRLSRYVPAHKLSIVPWGVDYNQYYTSVFKPGPFRIVYFGQLRPYKGLPVLLKAVQGLEGAEVWVIGDGHSAEEYRKQAAQMGLRQVKFWGCLPDDETIQLLKQAHAIVLPSITRSEAFGIVLLEGMAAGMVPVASHLPGVSELVGNDGFTFPPGDAVALRSILERLRDNPDLRLHLSSLAQARAQLYSWERVIYGYERIFMELAGSKPTEEYYPLTWFSSTPLFNPRTHFWYAGYERDE
jgi:glycosyltransferase involved in cell wall biosynthesis